jgi:hypothetical protein
MKVIFTIPLPPSGYDSRPANIISSEFMLMRRYAKSLSLALRILLQIAWGRSITAIYKGDIETDPN